jgi:site-specific DNA recombinase
MSARQRTTKSPRDNPPPGTGLRCAIYSRKSNADAASEEFRSVTRQIQRSREYAMRKGWRVEAACVFADDGISGAEFKRRPGLTALLCAAEAKAFDVLVMSEPSRLGREQAETAYVLKRIADSGARVFYYLEDREAKLDDATGKFIEAVHNFGSEIERERIRQRTRDGLRSRAASGFWTGGYCGYGYRPVPVFSGRTDADGQAVRDHVDRAIEPAEAMAVKNIFAMYLAGFGLTAIAKCLNGDPKRAKELREFFGGVCPPAPRHGSGSWAAETVRDLLRRPVYKGELVWGAKRNGRGPDVVVSREDLRIVDHATWEAVQARLKERGESYLRQAGGKLFGRAEMGREATYLWSGGFLRCAWCGGQMSVGKKLYHPPRSWYTCSYHVKRGDTVCANGVVAPVAALDNALLDSVEQAVLDPVALGYVLDKAAAAIRRTLAEDPGHIETLRQQRAETQRKITRLVEAVTEGQPPRAILEQLKALEAALERLDGEITAVETRGRLGQLDVARAIRELEPALAAWREILRGNPARARQVLRKIVAEPIVMEPLPEVPGYRWTGKLNGGAVLEGTQKYLQVRGDGPLMEQWITSPTGRSWRITVAAGG